MGPRVVRGAHGVLRELRDACVLTRRLPTPRTASRSRRPRRSGPRLRHARCQFQVRYAPTLFGGTVDLHDASGECQVGRSRCAYGPCPDGKQRRRSEEDLQPDADALARFCPGGAVPADQRTARPVSTQVTRMTRSTRAPEGRAERGPPGRGLRVKTYCGGVGVSWVRYIACTSSSSWTVGPTTAMPRANMERQLRVKSSRWSSAFARAAQRSSCS